MPRDTFPDYLESLVQIGRYATADARPLEALVRAALRVADAAEDSGSVERARAASEVAERIARRALASDALDEEEREGIAAILDRSPVARRLVV